jgi:hypothetical protein
VTYQWEDCDRAFIAQRYDRIAGLIGVFDRLFFSPGASAQTRGRSAELEAGRPRA